MDMYNEVTTAEGVLYNRPTLIPPQKFTKFGEVSSQANDWESPQVYPQAETIKPQLREDLQPVPIPVVFEKPQRPPRLLVKSVSIQVDFDVQTQTQ